MNKRNYSKRIRIPLNGLSTFLFFTKSCLRVAKGYNKIIIDKKPIVEFEFKNISLSNLNLIKNATKKDGSEWTEYRTKDYCRLKIMKNNFQNKFYCCLAELVSKDQTDLVEKYSYNVV